ncbi:hypothetical protein HMPREF9371_0489 [Neisseria shayeganii 871]|uniref:Uncharacterized protein n=1 Tax=Neisseria shayeganii 871 TaxID=1032488 RepID=G4CFV0_9NEIS|nr:hypothetical protein HMPREF9371_0489 [Neisseria shayeganii 871]
MRLPENLRRFGGGFLLREGQSTAPIAVKRPPALYIRLTRRF